jgi:hypothetical protein
MPHSALDMYTSADASNSQIANATTAPIFGFGSSGTVFGVRSTVASSGSITVGSSGSVTVGSLGTNASCWPIRDQISGFLPNLWGRGKPQLAPVRRYRRGAVFSSIALILADTGSPGQGDRQIWKDILAAGQEEKTLDASTTEFPVRLVRVLGSDTTSSTDPGNTRFGENATTPEGPRGLAGALRDLQDFSHDDWDADGARAITPGVISEVAHLLSLLPDGIPEPEVAPASDGSVCMEWDSAAGSLWLDIGSDRSAQTLVKVGSLREQRRFRADAPDLATHLRVACARLYPSKRDFAIRRVMVAA